MVNIKYVDQCLQSEIGNLSKLREFLPELSRLKNRDRNTEVSKPGDLIMVKHSDDRYTIGECGRLCDIDIGVDKKSHYIKVHGLRNVYSIEVFGEHVDMEFRCSYDTEIKSDSEIFVDKNKINEELGKYNLSIDEIYFELRKSNSD